MALLAAIPIIGPLLKALIDGFGGIWLKSRQQNIDAQSTHEARVEAVTARELEVEKREAELNATSRDIEAQGKWYQRLPRPAMAWIVVALLAKVLLWDKALGQWTGGHTDPLSADLWWVVKTIIISYFGGRSAEKVADKLAGIWKGK